RKILPAHRIFYFDSIIYKIKTNCTIGVFVIVVAEVTHGNNKPLFCAPNSNETELLLTAVLPIATCELKTLKKVTVNSANIFSYF
ncbi:hypothetical protein, partial [Chryseobacterium sp. CH1]|uniref:hypothetical protein n=1 Tax=Chryseobacterium sp. CH1 TaxID=713551 RepID=UPI001027F542